MKGKFFPRIGMIAKRSLVRTEPDVTIQAAASLMASQGVSSVIVETGGARNIFSSDDLIAYVNAGGDCARPLSAYPLRELSCVDEDMRLLAVLECFETRGVRHLGVIDAQGGILGVVTASDILMSIDPSVLLEHKTVGELIQRKEPVTFTADWMLEDVLHHLNAAEDAVLIVEERRPVGIVTTKDVFRLVANAVPMDRPLGEVMSRPVVTIPTTASISETLKQLQAYRIKRAIVVDTGGLFAGVITQGELIGYAYGSWLHILRDHSLELQELIDMITERSVATGPD